MAKVSVNQNLVSTKSLTFYQIDCSFSFQFHNNFDHYVSLKRKYNSQTKSVRKIDISLELVKIFLHLFSEPTNFEEPDHGVDMTKFKEMELEDGAGIGLNNVIGKINSQ